MKIQLHDDCFVIEYFQIGNNTKKEPMVYEFDAPDTISQKLLMDYISVWKARGNPMSIPQFEALLELLMIADGFGHNINHLLLIATASCLRQVVFDQHLQPKASS